MGEGKETHLWKWVPNIYHLFYVVSAVLLSSSGIQGLLPLAAPAHASRWFIKLGALCLGLGERQHQWPRNVGSMDHGSLRT